jgi:RNA polymerase sigma-70 factor (ECF subfamily)
LASQFLSSGKNLTRCDIQSPFRRVATKKARLAMHVDVTQPMGATWVAAQNLGGVQRSARTSNQSCHDEAGAKVSAELLESIAENRDREAFKELFAYYGPRVKAYLRRLGADGVLAEELTQEVMLTVWRRAHLFDRRQAAVSTWIYTIARNKRIDAIRREKWPEAESDYSRLEPEADEPPDVAVAAEQRSDRLHQAVRSLPDQQAMLLRMAFFEDKSHSAIAKETELPLGTVKSRLRLAMTRLRTMLEDVQ